MCRTVVNENLKDESIRWGIDNNILFRMVQVFLKISLFDKQVQSDFLKIIELNKYTNYEFEKVKEIKMKLFSHHPKYRIMWNDLWTNCKIKTYFLKKNPDKIITSKGFCVFI